MGPFSFNSWSALDSLFSICVEFDPLGEACPIARLFIAMTVVDIIRLAVCRIPVLPDHPAAVSQLCPLDTTPETSNEHVRALVSQVASSAAKNAANEVQADSV